MNTTQNKRKPSITTRAEAAPLWLVEFEEFNPQNNSTHRRELAIETADASTSEGGLSLVLSDADSGWTTWNITMPSDGALTLAALIVRTLGDDWCERLVAAMGKIRLNEGTH